jgi:hypothetical protein
MIGFSRIWDTRLTSAALRPSGKGTAAQDAPEGVGGPRGIKSGKTHWFTLYILALLGS